MRPRIAASILAGALLTAGCGASSTSDSATEGSAPPAQGSTAAPADSAAPVDASAAPETAAVEFGKSAAQSSSDDPEQTHALISGRYRFAWDTPSDTPCSRVEIAATQVDGDFRFVKSSTAARFNATVNDLPQGHYKLEQLDPGCTAWDLRIDWMTN